MRPGRKPKPTVLRVLHGSHKKRNVSEPRPAPAIPPMPDYVAQDKGAKALWEALAPQLLRQGLLSELDGTTLGVLCSNAATAAACARRIRRFGLVMTTPNGYLQERPEVSIKLRAEKMMQRAAEEFGLSPSDRSRITGAQGSPPGTPADLTMGGLLDYSGRGS